MSVSNEIIKVFDALAEKLGMVIDWSSENIIPYLEQLCDKYINYEIVTSVVWIVFGIVLLILGCFGIGLTKKLSKKFYELERLNPYDINSYDVAAIFTGLGTGIAFLVAVIVIMVNFFDIVTCLTFPEKIILDEVKSVINNK